MLVSFPPSVSVLRKVDQESTQLKQRGTPYHSNWRWRVAAPEALDFRRFQIASGLTRITVWATKPRSFQLTADEEIRYEVVCQNFNCHVVARRNVIYNSIVAAKNRNSRHRPLYTLAEHCGYEPRSCQRNCSSTH